MRSDFYLTRYFADRFGVPTIMDNDATVGALGEGYHGAGLGHSPFFYMTLSTGIGGGILIDGKPLRGPDSYAGEIGHINVVPDGRIAFAGIGDASKGCAAACGFSAIGSRSALELLQDPQFVRKYVVLLAPWIEGGYHDIESFANRDRRRNREGRRRFVRPVARGAFPAGHELVASED